MKRKILCLLLTSLALFSCLCFSFGTSALSPALSVLANDLVMSKCGLLGNELAFCPEDFDQMTDARTESITVLTLPAPESGTLYLDGVPVECFTEIARDDISSLTFRSACDKVNACSFTLRQQTDSGKYQALCNLYMLDRLNFAPTITDEGENAVGCTTYAGIMTAGGLLAVDPEGDPVTFRIVSYPQKGTVTLYQNEYRYTAFDGSTGTDSFSVIAIDRYGNRSPKTEIPVTVLPRKSNLSYTDMEGNAAYPAALTLSYCGALSGTVIGGEAVFCPDEALTRAEFIAALVSALGIETDKNASPVFADAEVVPDHLLPAISAALNNNWLTINTEEAFCPNDPISRKDAASILCRAMGIEFEKIPGTSEGEQALLIMATRNIFPLRAGALEADSVVTRAEGAVAICQVLDRL